MNLAWVLLWRDIKIMWHHQCHFLQPASSYFFIYLFWVRICLSALKARQSAEQPWYHTSIQPGVFLLLRSSGRRSHRRQLHGSTSFCFTRRPPDSSALVLLSSLCFLHSISPSSILWESLTITHQSTCLSLSGQSIRCIISMTPPDCPTCVH